MTSNPAPDAPAGIWATGGDNTGSWNLSKATMRNPPPETSYTRTDLYDAALARIAELEARDDAQVAAITNMTNKAAADFETIDRQRDRMAVLEVKIDKCITALSVIKTRGQQLAHPLIENTARATLAEIKGDV